MSSSNFTSPVVTSSQSMQPPPPRGWWSRNWKWFVPAGCLTLVLIFAAGIFGFVMLIAGTFKNTDVYKQAMAKAGSNSEVVQKLGTPLKSGMFMSGSVNVEGSSGAANLTIPISGPKGKGNIYLEARKFAGEWTFQRLLVGVDGEAERINLLPGAPQELQEPLEPPKPRTF